MRMRQFVVIVIALACAACAAHRPYLLAPAAKENVSAGIAQASMDITAQGCRLTLAIKGAGTGEVALPREWCEDAKRAMTVLATVPPPPPPPTIAPEVKK